MNRNPYLENISPGGKLLLLTGLILMFGILTAFSGLLFGKIYFDVDLTQLSDYISNPQSNQAIAFTKFYQFINQLGIFILPSILFIFLVSPSHVSYLKLGIKPSTVSMIVAGLMIYTILPFNHFLGEWNAGMVLPESLSGLESWIKSSEDQARLLTEAFLSTNTFQGLLLNIFIVAVIPAIGEEMLFRGILLRLLKDLTGNIHLAVIFSAFVFAFFHLQFYGFLPRFLLGIMLGYLFVITGSLWIPMFAHFVNNASSVIIFYLHHNGHISIAMDDFGSSPGPVYIIGSLLITAWLLMMIYRRERPSIRLQ